MNLIFAYVDKIDLVRELTEIVNEELDHFRQVLDLLEERGMRFRRLTPSSYGRQLNDLVRKLEPGRAVDRFLVAGLIEARSCERFALLKDRLSDKPLAAFYASLFESERGTTRPTCVWPCFLVRPTWFRRDWMNWQRPRPRSSTAAIR